MGEGRVELEGLVINEEVRAMSSVVRTGES